MATNSLVVVAIDDTLDNLITLEAVVADVLPGAQVRTATNGWQGIELVRAADPDVILLDVIMPGMDGFEVCRRLKDDDHLRHIPVVFLTALRSDRDSRLRAIEVGAEGFLTKPIEEAELITQVRAMAKIKAANLSQRRESERLAALVAERTRELEQELVERRNAEAALRRSEEKFRAIAEQLSDTIFLVDEQGVITYVSPAAKSFSGLTPEELPGHHFSDFLDETALPIAVAAFDEVMREGTPTTDLRLRMKRRDGTTFVGELSASRLLRGPRTDCLGTIRDISDRVRAEEALADERRLLRIVIDNLPDAIYAKDIHLRKTLANRAELELIGAASELDVLGKTDPELFPPEVAERFRADDWRVLQTGQPMLDHEELWVDARGRSRWQLTSTFPLKDDAGQTVGLVGIGRDITERKQAEADRAQLLAQIEAQARQVRQIMETAPQGMVLLDADGRVLLTNPVAERDMALLAHGAGDRLLGLGDRSLSELFVSLPGELWHEVQAAGRIFEVTARPIPYNGDPERWVLVIDDVTLKRRARDQLQQQERLAAIGQLAAGIAHDFNNIMAVIVVYAQMVSGQAGLPPTAREKVDVIHEQAYRATDLIQQILDFSRRAPMERQSMQLLTFLKEVVRLWERTLPESIRIELVHDGSACRISADPTRIQQVLMNLATNARDAMPEGGSLRIELRQVTYDVDAAAPVPTMAAGEWVRLDFTDTGTGMSPEVLSHIFEPFFTTKAPGEGTGLGLAQAHGIIKQHEGEILVESAPGQGTTFSIYLPALPVKQFHEVSALEAGSLPQGSGQLILVVEDNAATRDALVGALEMLGYRILPAANGKEALAIHTTHLGDGVDPVNLIISDLTMPDMGGKALASALRKLEAAVPLVILTGYVGDDAIADLADLGVVRCLRKPLDLSKLAQVVAELLG